MLRVFRDPLLLQSVQLLKGVGPRRGEALQKLGIERLGDLLFHFPRSYDDLSNVQGLEALRANELQTVVGEVVELETTERNDGRRVLRVVISDTRGRCLEGVWFGDFGVARKCRYGQRVSFSGKPRWFKDHWSMSHPRIEVLDGTEGPRAKVVPVYPLTENLRADDLRDHIHQALGVAADKVEDILPEALRVKRQYPTVNEALWQVHFPEVLAQGLHAKRRFIYEEFLVLQIALAARRRDVRDRRLAPKLPVDSQIDERIRKLFPFNLTGDQLRATRIICKDLACDKPMQRLLQADVGAGKTAVAVYAMLVAVANKHQVALMAPTEILARQHWETIDAYLAKSRVRRLILTGGMGARKRHDALDEIRSGEVDVVVGTQALVQDDVQFAKLGLVVIDEQHKFGVQQRARIRKLGGRQNSGDAHYLVMTATPIPRTIALTVFGDLDVSMLKEMPPGRQPVATRWHSESERERIYEQIRGRIHQGRQAFIVCPLVEESETSDLRAAQQTYEELKEGPFSEFRVGLVHGRLSDEEKEHVMRAFRAGNLDLLVATVVIEVGIDVPNATVMVIEHAERFGLSQLHQLRGRVSRGTVSGECHLFTGTTTSEAQERLRVFTRTTDGFILAEEDARLRGLGEFFGARQHGLGDLELGDLLHDRELLEIARNDAKDLVSDDPKLGKPEHQRLRRAVLERYGTTMDLVEIG